MSAQPGERPWPIIAFYVVFFMVVGVSLPFIPAYFTAAGFTATQAGVLLSVGPTFSLFMPPLWGQVSDRLGRPGAVLALLTGGGAAGYALMTAFPSYAGTLVGIGVQTFFLSGAVSLIDTLALQHVERFGGNYARLRTFGSVGFCLTALPFGFLVTDMGRWPVVAPLVLLVAATALSLGSLARAPARTHAGPKPTVANALALLRRPDLALFLAASTLHWMACTPYHGSLAPHVSALGLPSSVVSLSFTIGVVVEIAVMWAWPRWSSRVSPQKLLLTCFLVSAARWALMAVTSSGPLLVAAALLHGLTFGAFYLASVEWMVKRAPGSLRATGQALFAAATFGVGGVLGYRASGVIYDAVGGHQLFWVAAGLELLPAGLILLAHSSPERADAPAP